MNDITIQSVARYFLTNVAARLLAIVGGALVTHGVTTADQWQQQVGPLTQDIVGGALVAASAAEAWYRARSKRSKEIVLASAPQSEVTVK